MAIVKCTIPQFTAWAKVTSITPERYYVIRSLADEKIYVRPSVTTSRVNTFIINGAGLKALPAELIGFNVVECDLYQLEEDRR